ncbi:hypothetical protein GCM10018987_02880 [Streptomyces cremeus]
MVPEAVGIKAKYDLTKGVKETKSTRGVTKRSMKLNGESPEIEIGPETFQVTIGEGAGTGTGTGTEPGTGEPGANRGTTTDARTVLKKALADGDDGDEPDDKLMFDKDHPQRDPELYETELPMAQRYFLF